MLRTRWTRWFSRAQVSARPSPAAAARRVPLRPHMEPLEDRLAPATRIWTGQGLDNRWSNDANWAGGLQPAAKDDIIFPGATPRLVNIHDLPAGTTYNSITFNGPNYRISGNPLNLGKIGIKQNVAGINWLEMDLIFGTMTPPISVEARPFNIAAGGNLVLGGLLSGPAGIDKYGAGVLTVTGISVSGRTSNTYCGDTQVLEGSLVLSKPLGTVAVPVCQDPARPLNKLVIGDGGGGLEADRVETTEVGQLSQTLPVFVNSSGLLALKSTATASNTLAGLNLSGGHVDSGEGALILNGTACTLPDLRTAVICTQAAGTAGVLRGTINLGAVNRIFDVADGPSSDDLLVQGSLNLSGSLTKTGLGRLVLAAPNNLTNTVIVEVGILNVRNNQALGIATAGTTVVAKASLELEGGVTLADEPVSLTDAGGTALPALRSVSGNNIWKVPLTLLSDLRIDVTEGQLSMETVISGPWGVTKLGDGTLAYTGTAANTYTGATTVQAGTLLLAKAANVVTVPGEVRRNAGDTAGIIAGDFLLNGASKTFTITRGGGSDDLIVSARIFGTAGLVLGGSGLLRLTGTNTYTGATNVTTGTLLVDGTVASVINVATGGTLGGTGTVGTVISAGAVEPGQSPGILRAGAVTFVTGGTFRVELNGTTPGTGHDQLVVGGALNLTGANLEATPLTPTVGGNRFTILSNTTAVAAVGTFNGLPEGGQFTVGGRPFAISYRGGDGNDVTLTDVSVLTVTSIEVASATTPRFGDTVTLRVLVRPATGSGVPTGQITLFRGTAFVSTAPLLNGVASFTLGKLAVGSYSFTAEYEGDNTFNASKSSPFTLTVAKALLNLTLTANPTTIRTDQTTQLALTSTGSQTFSTQPTGIVTYRNGATVLGTQSMPVVSLPPLVVSGLKPGNQVLTASYEGDSNFEAATWSVTVRVNPPLTPDEYFVSQLYVDLLRRPADAAGLAGWTARIAQGVTREEVAQAIQNSVEYRTYVVQEQYQRLLRRPADPAGLKGFVALLGDGWLIEQVQAALLASSEYAQARGQTDEVWLHSAYRDVFNRDLDLTGRDGHLNALMKGTSRQSLAEILFASTEYHTNLIKALYQNHLGRPADAAGLNAFLTVLRQGGQPHQLINVITGSAEYYQRVQPRI